MQTTAPAPQGVPTTTVDRVAGVLRRAAVALNSRLSLGNVLDLFTHEILAHTDAHRASLLLCQTVGDPSDHRVELHPAASAARTDDPALMQAFRSHAVLTLNARGRARPDLDEPRSQLEEAGGGLAAERRTTRPAGGRGMASPASAEELVATSALYPHLAQMSSQQDDDTGVPVRQGGHDATTQAPAGARVRATDMTKGGDQEDDPAPAARAQP